MMASQQLRLIYRVLGLEQLHHGDLGRAINSGRWRSPRVPGPGGGGSGDLIVGFIVGQTHFKFNKSIKLYGVKLLDI
jgi:hypothetical protein